MRRRIITNVSSHRPPADNVSIAGSGEHTVAKDQYGNIVCRHSHVRITNYTTYIRQECVACGRYRIVDRGTQERSAWYAPER